MGLDLVTAKSKLCWDDVPQAWTRPHKTPAEARRQEVRMDCGNEVREMGKAIERSPEGAGDR